MEAGLAAAGQLQAGLVAKPLDPGQPPGVILYNPLTGRVVKATISLKLRGDLTVVIGNTDTKVELEQTQTTTIEGSNDPLMPVAAPVTPTAPTTPPTPPKK